MSPTSQEILLITIFIISFFYFLLIRRVHTSTFLEAVLISMATARQTEAKDKARLVEVDWARAWRMFSHQGEISLSRDCDKELSLGNPPSKSWFETKNIVVTVTRNYLLLQNLECLFVLALKSLSGQLRWWRRWWWWWWWLVLLLLLYTQQNISFLIGQWRMHK